MGDKSGAALECKTSQGRLKARFGRDPAVLGDMSFSKLVDNGARSTQAGGGVTGNPRSAGRGHLPGVGGQVVQAGLDVLAVVVALLLIEGGLGAQALERGLELHQLRLPPLPVPALVADILGFGEPREGVSLSFLTGEPRGLTRAQSNSL